MKSEILNAVAELIGAKGFSRALVESILGVDLAEDDSSTNYFAIFKIDTSTSPQRSGNNLWISAEVRLPKARGGVLMMITPTAATVSKNDIIERFGNPTDDLARLATPENPHEADSILVHRLTGKTLKWIVNEKMMLKRFVFVDGR